MFESPLQRGTFRTAVHCLIGCAGLVAAVAAPASAQFKAWVMAKFPDTPEGMAVDSRGNIYTTLFHTGELVELKGNGTYEHIAWVPSKEESGKGDLEGLDLDKSDNIYVAYKAHSRYDGTDLAETDLINPHHPSCRDATVSRSGVYRIDAKTRKVTPVATRADGWPFCFPDDIAVDSHGNVYMTDLTYAGIWKISADGKVNLWSADPLLNWSARPASGFPIGVNDLALDKQEKNIYAVTDGDPMVLRIPIKEDGSAGDPQVIQPNGWSVFDGVELDAKGNIYVSEILRNEIWVISPDGSQRVLIANKATAPLDNNTSLILKGDTLCTANLGYFHPKPEQPDRTVVCMTGFSVPK
jgi:sugar lactone lactonase YvrE